MRMAYASAARLHAVGINPNVSAAAAGDYVAKGGEEPGRGNDQGDVKASRAGSRAQSRYSRHRKAHASGWRTPIPRSG
jgi:hypothetical protein